jgi:hypothetical protein
MKHDELLEVRQSKFGKGIFAKKFIGAGTIICKVPSEPTLDFLNTKAMGEIESHALQVDVDLYTICQPPFLYSNHSCNPNCALNANFEFFALRNINADEEMFWDYSTSMLERSWTMACKCGEKNCRKIITDFDLLPHALQQKYLQLKIVLPFIAHMQRQYAKRA